MKTSYVKYFVCKSSSWYVKYMFRSPCFVFLRLFGLPGVQILRRQGTPTSTVQKENANKCMQIYLQTNGQKSFPCMWGLVLFLTGIFPTSSIWVPTHAALLRVGWCKQMVEIYQLTKTNSCWEQGRSLIDPIILFESKLVGMRDVYSNDFRSNQFHSFALYRRIPKWYFHIRDSVAKFQGGEI